jgi:ATP-dependent Lon protease
LRQLLSLWKNKKDLVDIPEEYRKKLNFVPVKTIDEVFEVALIDWMAQGISTKATKKKSTTKKKTSKGSDDSSGQVAA